MQEERPYSLEFVKYIRYYNQDFVKEAIINLSKDKEVVGSFGGKGYAKRPDVLENNQDIIELIKKGVTSFHVSEETWKNPLLLETGAKKKDQDLNKKGWDLVLDIDCPEFEFSRIVAELVIEFLKYYIDERNITCKFSGNHGFHIAVPFESFPETIGNGILVKYLFPEAPQKIVKFIMDRIDNPIDSELRKAFIKKYGEENLLNIISEKIHKDVSEFHSNKNQILFREILEIDTILISPRHLFRSIYSINEKTLSHPDGCKVSVPWDINKIQEFEKSSATIDYVINNKDFFNKIPFLNRDVVLGSSSRLFIEAYDYDAHFNKYAEEIKEKKESEKAKYNFQIQFEDENKYSVESFPPCILNGLNGLKDGRKRFLFLLRNFLNSANWNKEEIKNIFEEWNLKNFEPLRQSEIEIQTRYITKKVLPPNCDRKEYYEALGICTPDGMCKKIKNPISYAKKKSFLLQKEKDLQEKIKKREEKAKNKKTSKKSNKENIEQV